MLIVLLAAVLSGAAPQASRQDDWQSCVTSAAEKWAMNRDGADVIADGAIGACQSREPSAVSETEMRRVRQAAIAAVLARRRP